MYENIKTEAAKAITELIEASGIKTGELLIVGCSSSEMIGGRIGKNSSFEAAEAAFEGIYGVLKEKGINIAAQCCEHLNRAVIIERSVAEKKGIEIVNVLPQPKAGGSFATVTWQRLEDPVAVETIKADAGIDIGDTLIGMHLKPVAVPVRLSMDTIGEAHVVFARTRPKFIGGSRAVYADELK